VDVVRVFASLAMSGHGSVSTRSFVQRVEPMAGVMVLGGNLRVSRTVEELLVIAGRSEPEEWAGACRPL